MSDVRKELKTLREIDKLDEKAVASLKALAAGLLDEKYKKLTFSMLYLLPIDSWWRVFVDGCDQYERTPVTNFESREPGYFQAIFTAWDMALKKLLTGKIEIDIAFILELHKMALTEVNQTNYGKEEKALIGKFYNEKVCRGIRLSWRIATSEGIKQILTKMTHQRPDRNFISVSIYPIEYPREINRYLSSKTSEALFDELPADEYISISSNNKMTHNKIIVTQENIKNITIDLFETTVFMESNLDLEQKSYDAVVQWYLDCFHNDMKESETSGYEQLKAIVKLVQDCEQLHPFKDGNGRTFCMLLLNYLLLRYGFPPTILYQPLAIHGYSLDEAVLLVYNGMVSSLSVVEKNTETYPQLIESELLFLQQLQAMKMLSTTLGGELNNSLLSSTSEKISPKNANSG